LWIKKACFAYQHVYECLHALEHFQHQQDRMPWDLMVEPNYQKGNWFEEGKAAKNLKLENSVPSWHIKIHSCKKLSYNAENPLNDNSTHKTVCKESLTGDWKSLFHLTHTKFIWPREPHNKFFLCINDNYQSVIHEIKRCINLYSDTQNSFMILTPYHQDFNSEWMRPYLLFLRSPIISEIS